MTASIGTVGDSFDNAMAESVMGIFKTELHRNPAVLSDSGGHWKGLDDLEIATCAWASWFNESVGPDTKESDHSPRANRLMADLHVPPYAVRHVCLYADNWVDQHHNVMIVGPTGVGKTFVACALAHSAIRGAHNALYVRSPRLLDDLAIARGDGRLSKVMSSLARFDVLVLDDFLIRSLNDDQGADLLEVVDDRSSKSTIVTSQLPVKHWHEGLGDHRLIDRLRAALTPLVPYDSIQHNYTPEEVSSGVFQITTASVAQRPPTASPGGGRKRRTGWPDTSEYAPSGHPR